MRDTDEFRLAVGFFDGVHLGHQALLKGADGVLTFRNHPKEVLSPDRAPSLLMSLSERIEAIRSCGIGEINLLDFTHELANESAERFLTRLDGYSPAGRNLVIRCGENWRFGKDGVGDANFLGENGMRVEIVPYTIYAGEKVSSSRIRDALAAGLVEEAAKMLGRAYEIRGKVVPGKGLGRELGFATLNIAFDRSTPLKRGVYAVEAQGLMGVANYGLAPTLGQQAWEKPVLEVHFLEDFLATPPETLSVRFLGFLREERKFADIGELKKQISHDCQAVQTERKNQR